ncbi:hypothetical protein LINPERPRIM_LOCUS40663 [Linum perenne]
MNGCLGIFTGVILVGICSQLDGVHSSMQRSWLLVMNLCF